jgi:hypothetical protein
MIDVKKPLGYDPSRIKGVIEQPIVCHYENNHGDAVKRLKRVVAAVVFCLAVGRMAMADTVEFNSDTLGAPPARLDNHHDGKR